MQDSQLANTAHDDSLAAFVEVRPRLFGIAYRMLGSSAEAEDIVQDVWLRWQTSDRNAVQNASAFLATTTTRLALNLAQSARSRRETYVGSWLPEPVATEGDPHLGAERAAALEFAVLLLLEKLTPTERAAYVLREAFDYPYHEISEVLQTSEANVRQLVSRARKHISNGRRTSVSAAERRRLFTAFVEAARNGDLEQLERLLASDVASSADGGGIVRATRTPVVGRERVAKFIAAIASHFRNGVTLTWIEANAQPAILISRGTDAVACATIDASEEGIHHIMWMMRPSKLAAISHLNRSLGRAHLEPTSSTQPPEC